MIFSPKPFSTNVECGDNVETIYIDYQTLVVLPEDCKLQLRNNFLTTDVNVYVDYNIRRLEWVYEGNIFDELIEDDLELGILIQELISTKSKFGLKDLNHLKHYYAYTESALDQVWKFLSNLSFLGYFDEMFLVIFITTCVAILVFLIYNGYFPKCKCGSNQVEDELQRVASASASARRARMVRNIRQAEEVARQEARDTLDVDLPEFENINQIEPPPYVMFDLEPTAPRGTSNLLREDSYLSMDGRYAPTLLTEDRLNRRTETEQNRGVCNPGPVMERGQRLRDWVCNSHVPQGQSGHCIGYFRPRQDNQPQGAHSHR